MRMQHMETLCFNLSVAKKTLVMLFPTLIAVNRSTGLAGLCLCLRHICTDARRRNEDERRGEEIKEGPTASALLCLCAL